MYQHRHTVNVASTPFFPAVARFRSKRISAGSFRCAVLQAASDHILSFFLPPILCPRRYEVRKEDHGAHPVSSSSSRTNTSMVQTSLYDEWRPFYIDYNLLKRELKVSGVSFRRIFFLITPSPSRRAPHPASGTTRMNANSPPCSRKSWTRSTIFRSTRLF